MSAAPVAAAGEARVRVAFCGVCGSDLHRFRGDLPLIGVTPGHEISGVVDSVGAGRHVRSRRATGCASSRSCRVVTAATAAPAITSCAPAPTILAGDVDGGFAEFVNVPATMLHRLPDTIPLDQAALMEPLAVAVHAVRQGGVGPGSSVCVLGAGTIGLLVLQAARAHGAGQVLITAKHAHQAEVAAIARRRRRHCRRRRREIRGGALTDGDGVDCVIETVGGHAPTPALAMDLARKRGRIVIVGGFAAPSRSISARLVHEGIADRGLAHLRLRPAHASRFRSVSLGLVASGRVRLEPFTQHRFPSSAFRTRARQRSAKKRRPAESAVAC